MPQCCSTLKSISCLSGVVQVCFSQGHPWLPRGGRATDRALDPKAPVSLCQDSREAAGPAGESQSTVRMGTQIGLHHGFVLHRAAVRDTQRWRQRKHVSGLCTHILIYFLIKDADGYGHCMTAAGWPAIPRTAPHVGVPKYSTT